MFVVCSKRENDDRVIEGGIRAKGETCLRQVGKDERVAGMDKWRCTERGISK